jgi:hypothetical protein
MTEEPDPRGSIFAVMWDCNGLEAVVKVPNPADRTFALLKGTEPPKMPALNHWRLRAQLNTPRHYEIYLVTAEVGITADDIRDMFEASPQTAADTIRKIGTVFYSDRQTQKKAVIV